MALSCSPSQASQCVLCWRICQWARCTSRGCTFRVCARARCTLPYTMVYTNSSKRAAPGISILGGVCFELNLCHLFEKGSTARVQLQCPLEVVTCVTFMCAVVSWQEAPDKPAQPVRSFACPREPDPVQHRRGVTSLQNNVHDLFCNYRQVRAVCV